MSRNQTIVSQHSAERRFIPFSPQGYRPWQVGHWQYQETLPYAMSTIAADLLDDGWRELNEYDVTQTFGESPSTGACHVPVHRAFVKSDATVAEPNGMRRIITLTDKRKWIGERR